MRRRDLLTGAAVMLSGTYGRPSMAADNQGFDPFAIWKKVLGRDDDASNSEPSIVVANVESTPSTPATDGFPIDGVHDITSAWVARLLTNARLGPEATFVGKFFEDDVDGFVGRRGTVIAASEAFRDESKVWDRFEMTIATNFWQSDQRASMRRTLIKIGDYRFRGRANSVTPSSSMQFRRLADSNEETLRLIQIASIVRDIAKKMHGSSLGQITVSPTRV